MARLLDLMNEELKTFNKNEVTQFHCLEDFITNDKNSAIFIEQCSRGSMFKMPDNKSELFDIAQTRARHSAVTFLMGLVLGKAFKIFDKISVRVSSQDTMIEPLSLELWLLTALNHDVAYTLKNITNPNLNYQKTYTFYLLDDYYGDYSERNKISVLNDFSKKYSSFFAYSYDEIEAYDRYARQYHALAQDKEKVDHGILGGVYFFNRKVKYLNTTESSIGDYLLTKGASLTIAQHNIFKSNNKERDKKYPNELRKLYSTSDFVIDQKTPALLLLSLVDTVECVKRLSKKENKAPILETLTVLRNIEVFVDDNKVIVDYWKLKVAIENKEDRKRNLLLTKLEKHMGAIKSLKYWTGFNVIQEDEFRLNITFV